MVFAGLKINARNVTRERGEINKLIRFVHFLSDGDRRDKMIFYSSQNNKGIGSPFHGFTYEVPKRDKQTRVSFFIPS
jgi:hypothetical protein